MPTFQQIGAAFFFGVSMVFLGLALLMLYEAVVILINGREATISAINASEYLHHPVWWVVGACIASFSLGAFVTHITHWLP